MIEHNPPATLSNQATLLRGVDVARILNISPAMAYRLIQTGELPAVQIGRSVRVRPEDLSAYIMEHLKKSGIIRAF